MKPDKRKKIKIGGYFFIVTCVILTVIFIRAAIRAHSDISALYHSPHSDPLKQRFFKRPSAPITGKFQVLLRTELLCGGKLFIAKLPGFGNPLLVCHHEKRLLGIDRMGWKYTLLNSIRGLYEIVKLPDGPSGFLVAPDERYISAPKLIDFDGQELYSLQTVVKHPAAVTAATVRDLDHDGHWEVIMTVSTGYELQPRGLYIHDLASGQRKSHFNMGCNPYLAAFADVNSDGREEIILETYSPQNNSHANGLTDFGEGYVLLFDTRANLLSKYVFKYHYVGTHVALVDIDQDGRLEIVCTTRSWFRDWGELVILTADTLVPLIKPVHFPVSLGPPAVADIDNDGLLDIVVGAYNGNLYVFDHRLQEKSRTRFFTPNEKHHWFPVTLHALNDLDGDGDLEIIITTRYEDEVQMEPSRSVVETGNHKILILSPSLEIEQEIPMQGSTGVTIADFIPGGSNELIVNHPSITVFQAPTNLLYQSPFLPIAGAVCSILALFLFFFIRHMKKSKEYALRDKRIKKQLDRIPKLPSMEEIHHYRIYFLTLVDFYFSELYNFCGWGKNQSLENLRETLQTLDFWAQDIDEVIDLCEQFNQAENTSTPSFDELRELHEGVKRIIILFSTRRSEEDEW